MWYKEYTLEEVNIIFDRYMTKHLDIRVVEIRKDAIVASMPVTDKVRQPIGLLHGGASVVLAESIGSVASYLVVDPEKYTAVGLEVNANHLRSVRSGEVFATCSPIRVGGKTHVWDIKIHDEQQNLVCISRLTVAVITKK